MKIKNLRDYLPSGDSRQFLTLFTTLAALLLTGCTKPPSPVPRWEYKIVEVENFAHFMKDQAFQEITTNVDLSLRDQGYADRDAGDFHLDISPEVLPQWKPGTAMAIYTLGQQGWELVSSIPQLETVLASDTDGHQKYPNVRTAKIILIFKRPAAF